MALPLPRESAPEPPSSDLPATYRNPWQTLGENLQAVVADARLRARELWRRNGQGTLGRPSWWPADLAPLFWPLLLAAALALLLASFGGFALVVFSRVPVALEPPVAIQSSLNPQLSSETPLIPQLSMPLEPAPISEPSPAIEVVPQVPDSPLPEPPSPEPEPLPAVLTPPGADGLLISAQAMPDQLSLVLQLSPEFSQLPRAEQQQCADRWQQWSADLGYDHLELRDAHAVLLARDALVGGGMIVLIPPITP